MFRRSIGSGILKNFSNIVSGIRLRSKLKKIELILTDSDGVLTDGGLVFGEKGIEFVRYNVKDGLGFKLARQAGLKIGIVSGIKSPALQKRAELLGTDVLYMGKMDKRSAYMEIKRDLNINDNQIAYIGDDIIDLPILTRCGVAVAVADAHPEIIKNAHYVTFLRGGEGAVREFIDFLLKYRGSLKAIIKPYYDR